jgi:DNA modification methylase
MIENQIFNEDCLKTMSRMGDNSIDLVVTSPPYFNARGYSQYESVKIYMDTMRAIFTEVQRTLKECRFCVINISPVITPRENRNKESSRIPLPFYFVPMMEEIGFKFMEDIIWVKPEGAVYNRAAAFSRNRRPFTYKPNIVTEYILVFKTFAEKNIELYTREGSTISEDYERTNVWNMNPETHSKHPAPFPEKLPAKIISYYSYEGDLVYDPFLGSGTTAKMAKLANRKYLGSEINEDYFKIAQKRVENTQEYLF